MADFLDPGRGPDQRGGFRVSPTIFLLLAIGGFVVGAFGHLIKSRAIVALGIAMIFLATIFIPLFLNITH